MDADIANANDSASTHVFFAFIPHSPEIAVSVDSDGDLTSGTGVGFGSIPTGTSTDHTFTITNNGNEELTDLDLNIDGADAGLFSVVSGPLGTTSLGPTKQVIFTVRFDASGFGTKTATLHIASSDPDENPFNINLKGFAEDPEIAVDQPPYFDLPSGFSTDFGSAKLGSSSSRVFQVRNVGSTDLTGLGIAIDGANPGDFVVISILPRPSFLEAAQA